MKMKKLNITGTLIFQLLLYTREYILRPNYYLLTATGNLALVQATRRKRNRGNEDDSKWRPFFFSFTILPTIITN